MLFQIAQKGALLCVLTFTAGDSAGQCQLIRTKIKPKVFQIRNY